MPFSLSPLLTRSFSIGPYFVASVLFLAATLKGYQIVSQPTSFGHEMPGWLQLFLILSEITLGIWLCSGRMATTARWVSIAAFSLFAVYSGVKVWNEESDCGCFGALKVNPAYMFAFDLAAVALLFAWQPVRRSPSVHAVHTGKSHWVAASLSVLLLLSGVAASLALTPGRGVVPTLVVEEPEHDFGVVAPGLSLEHSFRIHNGFTEPVDIIGANANCGCTVVQGLVGQRIPPGETLEAKVTLSTGDGGRREGTIFVNYETPTMPVPGRLALRVTASVRRDYIVAPRGVVFGMVSSAEPVERVVRFTPNETPVELLSAVSSHPAFTVRTGNNSGAGERDIVVRFDPNKWDAVGTLHGAISCKTTSRASPEFMIPLEVHVSKPFELTPTAVVLSSSERGVVEKEVRLTSSQPCRVRLVSPAVAAVALEGLSESSSTEHNFSVIVSDTGGKSLATEIQLEVEFSEGASSSRRLSIRIPIHRLPYTKE